MACQGPWPKRTCDSFFAIPDGLVIKCSWTEYFIFDLHCEKRSARWILPIVCELMANSSSKLNYRISIEKILHTSNIVGRLWHGLEHVPDSRTMETYHKFIVWKALVLLNFCICNMHVWWFIEFVLSDFSYESPYSVLYFFFSFVLSMCQCEIKTIFNFNHILVFPLLTVDLFKKFGFQFRSFGELFSLMVYSLIIRAQSGTKSNWKWVDFP